MTVMFVSFVKRIHAGYTFPSALLFLALNLIWVDGVIEQHQNLILTGWWGMARGTFYPTFHFLPLSFFASEFKKSILNGLLVLYFLAPLSFQVVHSFLFTLKLPILLGLF